MPVPHSVDEFVGMLWRNNIRVGLSQGNIDAILQRWSNIHDEMLIAEVVEAIQGVDANLVPKVSLEVDAGIREDATGKSNLRICKCAFPQVPATNSKICILVQKTPMKLGKDGLQIT